MQDITFSLTTQQQLLLFALLAWSIVWKGIALWTAARHESKVWFIALLLINTVGILDILYIFFASRYDTKHDQ